MMKKQRKKSRGSTKAGLAMDKELKVFSLIIQWEVFMFIKLKGEIIVSNYHLILIFNLLKYNKIFCYVYVKYY